MAGNTISSGFVNLQNLVSEVLMSIDDMEEKRHQAIALQKILNTIRDINVHIKTTYEEVPITLDEDLRTGSYPVGCVKALSVGIYRHGIWWSFTKVPNMAKTMTADDETYDADIGEGVPIPDRGSRFGARGKNFGYWAPDDKNCRVIVRNYVGNKVILRYKSNGITCTTDTCIPYDIKDLIIKSVIYEFALSGKPRRHSGMELQLLRDERARVWDDFTDLDVLPQDFNELKDAEYASLNTTIRRD